MLTGSLEENVLALLCHSSKYAARVALQVTPELFTTQPYRVVAAEALKYLEEYNRPPKAHLIDLLEVQVNKGNDGALIARLIEGMAELFPSMNEEYIITQLDFFIRKSKMTKTAAAFAELVHRGKLDEAVEALTTLDVANPAMDGIWAHEPSQMLSFLDVNEEELFSTGIEELDLRNVRPARGTMLVLIAAPKKGKSWFLVNTGKQALLQGKNVLHISLENSEALTAKRYIQSIFAMAKDDVGTVRLPRFERGSERKRLQDVTGIELTDTFVPKIINQSTRADIAKRITKLKKYGRLHIKKFPMKTLTIGGYRQYLDYMERRHGFIADIVILDYPDLFSIPGNDYRLGLGSVFQSISGEASKRNHALVTVTQSNRGGARAKTIDVTNVGEDFSKIATADTVLTYNQTKQERGIGLARILVAAARDAPDQYQISITQAYAIGQFCLDSAYLTNDLRSLSEDAYGVEDQDSDNEGDG